MSGSTQVSLTPCKRFQRDNGLGNDEDRLSQLPESIICHILSRLTTKEALRTSVLSRDWEYKWICIYKVYIDDNEILQHNVFQLASFVNFVERILLHSKNIEEFHLLCYHSYDMNRLTGWISAVLRRNIGTLVFKRTRNDPLGEDLTVPRGLVNCASLRNLFLAPVSCTLKIFRAKSLFPSLTVLYLIRVRILNEDSESETLSLTFPVLEKLELEHCMWEKVELVEIYAPRLITFTSKPKYTTRVDHYSIKIVGAAFLNLRTLGNPLENFLLTESTVVHAMLLSIDGNDNLHRWYGLQVRKLLKDLSSLEKLSLSNYLCEAIAKSMDGLALPRYGKLEKLYVYQPNVAGLLQLLHVAPFLKTLFVRGWKVSSDQYEYDLLENVPSCIVRHLEEINSVDFGGTTCEYDIIKFVLRNGSKLKRARINIWGADILESDVLRQLSMFPKASACLAIDVTKHK